MRKWIKIILNLIFQRQSSDYQELRQLAKRRNDERREKG
jgi:hypothetical protein